MASKTKLEQGITLNDKQIMFCKEYIINYNGTASAKRAGYSESNAWSTACELTKNPKIKKYIAILEKERNKRLEISADRVLKEMAAIAFSDVSNVVSVDGGLVLVHDFEAMGEARKLIKSVSSTPTGIKIELHDKEGSLRMLAQHLGLLQKKVDITSGGQPLEPANVHKVYITHRTGK